MTCKGKVGESKAGFLGVGTGSPTCCPHFSVVTVSDQVTIFVIGRLKPVGVVPMSGESEMVV